MIPQRNPQLRDVTDTEMQVVTISPTCTERYDDAQVNPTRDEGSPDLELSDPQSSRQDRSLGTLEHNARKWGDTFPTTAQVTAPSLCLRPLPKLSGPRGVGSGEPLHYSSAAT